MIGSQLRQWRETRKLTQDAAAKALGVSYPTYKRYESERLAGSAIPEPVAKLVTLMGT